MRPLSGVLVVQGGPGTGKTAVALHRAAYLLYTHRFPLERQGVLVVGPNPLFLRYIEQVLPSLGETGVTLSTVAGLVPEIRVMENGPADVARLKGDVRGWPRWWPGPSAPASARCPRTSMVPYGALVLRLTAQDTRTDRGGRPAAPRHPQRPAAPGRAVGGPGPGRPGPPDPAAPRGRAPRQVTAFPGYEDPAELEDDEFDFEDFSRKVRRVPGTGHGPRPDVAPALPHELLHDLYGAPPLDRRGRPGDPDPRGAGSAPAPPIDLVRRGGVDAGRRRAGRRGPPPARPPHRGVPTSPCASTATSWWTRSRTCRPCSCGC